ncbi:hypothetical protein [Bradyrhizobium sp. HKCCYLRH3061]|uniref:hypothetical protein n=1 Tax=Bradyrhizobium sp. HKCCYLRH3061 TaxID=3420734 RepID=UPI003EC0CB21
MTELSATIEVLAERLHSGANLLDRLRARNASRPKRAASHLDDMDALMARITARGAADFAVYQAAHQDDEEEVSAKPVRKRRPLVFRERDITRAIAGALKAGLSVQRTEIDVTGRIVIVTGRPEPTDLVPDETPKTLRELI